MWLTQPYVKYGLFGGFLFWLLFFNYNSQHQISINRNLFTGDITMNRGGMYITAPWVQVSRIETRPFRICLDCGCKNINCKLVSFNPNGWEDFVKREGFKYYWWNNRISFNLSYKEEYRGIKSILKGYSDGKEYPFIILNDEI
jgi:hypothetical protein